MKRFWAVFVWLSLLGAKTVPDRYIVELAGEPVAVHLARQSLRADMRSPAALQRRAEIREQQRQARLQLEASEAEVLDGADTVANALLVRIPDAKAASLARLPGVVRVRPVREFKLLLDHAVAVHKVPDAWAQVGIDKAGAGAKIAIIDTGVDTGHPGLRDPILAAPDGFPKADADADLAFTNTKVIVARSYANLFTHRDIDTSARDRVGHGTALAMAAAGVTSAGPLATITGVAPKAYLGNYKVFGTPGINDGASEDAILKAIDDAVADGMDVISLSLGSDLAPRLEDDITVKALERAAGLGVLVVVAAGNNGPDPNTIGSPATAPSAIAVGASSNSRVFAAAATVEGGGPYAAILGSGPIPTSAITAPVLDVSSLDQTGLACSALPANSLAGSIALILRGICLFEDKLNNAQQAGAVGALVYTDADRPDPVAMSAGAATLPAEMVSYASGLDVKQRLAAQPLLLGTLGFTIGPVPVNPDRLAIFSPGGPNVDGTIKPELVAVGTSVYTATQKFDPNGEMFDPSGYIDVDGTSFSTPLVAGAAALLKSARPGLSVAQYRSLLINTAVPVSSSPGTPARVQQAGAGLLDASAALRATAAVSSTALNFGAGGPDAQLSRILTLSNVGTTADTFSVSVVPRDAGPAPTVSTNTVQLAPGGSFDLTVSYAASSLAPGPHEGFLTIQGSGSEAQTRIPYWYAVVSNVPAHITVLDAASGGRRGSAVRDAVIFRVTDVSGIPLSNVVPNISVISGGGEALDVSSVDDSVPGAYSLTVRLGALAGSNVFQIQAGELSKQVTIPGR